jgi:hypothetical protein
MSERLPVHRSTPAVPASGRRRSRRRQRVLAAALLAAFVCAPLPLLNEPAFAGDAAPTAATPAARQGTGTRSEIVSERTDSTTSWANADGTTTVETFTGPIRVKQPDGSWRPIDTTLVAEDGAVRPKTAAADISFSAGGSGAPLAEVSRGGRTLGLDWPGKLPEPRLDGPTAVYPGAVEGGDLVVTALKEGFSHSVVLHERPDGPVSYRLPVSADGLTLHETADERLRWSDRGGRTVATAPLPVMWGSAEQRASGEPKDLAAIDVTVERDADTGDQVLVLEPDEEFLAETAAPALVTALGERYGTDAVAVQVTPGVDALGLQANCYNDTTPYYGGARIYSRLTSNSASWCTAGFPWKYSGKWYMVTAGHCTTGNGAIMNPSHSDYIGPVVRDNWKNGYGSVKLSGQGYYSGDLALYRINSDSSASARIYKGGKTSTSSRPVHDYWRRWAQEGDKVCTGGMMTGEKCGWKVTDTQVNFTYSGGTRAKNMVVAKKTSGSCTINGDSGGPVYTVDGSGRAFAKGIISGGGGGGGDNSGGLFDPCWLYFTDIGLANSAFPGTVARY